MMTNQTSHEIQGTKGKSNHALKPHMHKSSILCEFYQTFEGGFKENVTFEGGFKENVTFEGGFKENVTFEGGFKENVTFEGRF